MKIYAKSSNYVPEFAPKQELDKYIGKDVWVKVLYNPTQIVESGHDCWYKFLDITSNGTKITGYKVQWFYDFQINSPDGVMLEDGDLSNFATILPKNFRVYNPIETMTTNEIYSKYL